MSSQSKTILFVAGGLILLSGIFWSALSIIANHEVDSLFKEI